MQLYILRHGETDWNTARRLQGSVDIPLNENGIRLAKETAEGLKDVPFSRCFTSPLKRAKDTAGYILAGRSVPVAEDARLAEIHFGEWEGLCCKEGQSEIPEGGFDNFFSDPFHFIPPAGAESIAQVCARMKSFLTELTAHSEWQDDTMLISSHGCAVRAMLHEISPIEGDFWRGKVPPNCSVTTVSVENGVMRIQREDETFYGQAVQREDETFYGQAVQRKGNA